MVSPVVHLALRASQAAAPLSMATSSRVLGVVSNTLRLGGLVVVGAVLLGVTMAWLLERTAVPGRRALSVVSVLPLVVPTYVAAIALRDAFGPRPLLVELPGMVGLPGATLVLVLSTYPYVLLLVRASLSRSDPALEEAARALGDGVPRSFVRVVLPGLRPAIVAGGLLVFLYVLSDFGAVGILQYNTLTVAIFTEYRTSFAREPAAVLGVVLVVLTAGAIAVERGLRGRPAAGRVVAARRPTALVDLGRWRWPAAVAGWCVVALGAGVPVGVLVYRAATSHGQGDPAGVLMAALTTSIGVSAAAAVVTVVVAVPVAVLAVRHRSAFSTAVETLSISGYALPGLVIALALVFFASRYVPAVYQTLTLVVLAYLVRFFPEALGSVRSSLLRIDPALEDAARSLGRRPVGVAATVTVPLLRSGLTAGAALVFLTAMKELPATLLLRPAGYDTLATRVWTGASEGFAAQAAPAGLVLVAVSALALIPLRRMSVDTPPVTQ